MAPAAYKPVGVELSCNAIQAAQRLHDVCRFSSDMDTIDDDLPFIMNIFLSEAFEMLGTLVVLVISQPLLAAAFVPLAFIYRWIQVRGLHTVLLTNMMLHACPMSLPYKEVLSGLELFTDSTVRPAGLRPALPCGSMLFSSYNVPQVPK